MPRMARCSANIPRNAGCICRSRRFQNWSSTRSWRPRTRTSMSMAASTLPAWRALRCSLHRIMARTGGRTGAPRSTSRPQGASTITQQVAKNFLLTNEVSFTRKIKEALLAMRLERTYSKDKILELYLNEIYLGLGAYGIAAASLVYFDKSVNELTISEAAYLAALPKAPAALHPVRNRDRAIERRNYVVDRLLENGWIKQADADKARKDPLVVTSRTNGAHIFAGEYFAEEVRRDIFERYGEKKLYEGGLSVRTTLDPKLQVMARKTMAAGLVNFDEAQGWRGAISKLDISGDWGVKLADVKSLSDIL